MDVQIYLTEHLNVPGIRGLKVWEQHGGYQAIRKCLKEYTPEQTVEVVKAAKLRGRGGAGFDAGRKWSHIDRRKTPRHLVCNADEGEPGTFKDQIIMRNMPHMLLEGLMCGGYALGATKGFIYIRGEYFHIANILDEAIEECRAVGYLGKGIFGSNWDYDIDVHRGAGAYICGEGSAILDSLQGMRGLPRCKPPHMASVGLYYNPSITNNVETLSNVPHIINRGPEWFTSIGPKDSHGNWLMGVSGGVQTPGVYELPLGTPLKDIIYKYGGGPLPGTKVKAIIPGGISAPMLTAQEAESVTMDYASVPAAGSDLGTCGVIVIPDNVCIVKVVRRAAYFYMEESCGQCTPCRIGNVKLLEGVEMIENSNYTFSYINNLNELGRSMQVASKCGLGQSSPNSFISILENFKEEIFSHSNEYSNGGGGNNGK